jgi:hypothetical protein
MDVMPILNKKLIDKIDEDAKIVNANVNEEEIVLDKVVEPRDQTEMFEEEEEQEEEPVKIIIKKVKKKKIDDILDIGGEAKPKKKRTYPHLEKARAKALINRQKRAEERKIEKAKKSEEKKEMKLEKARLRIEKKKETARNHYWEKKARNQELGIVENKTKAKSKPIDIQKSNGSNYDNFASMMDRYNSEKMTIYKQQQKLEKEAEERVKSQRRKKNLSNPFIQRTNVRGMYVNNPDYPNDFFF